ncbi:MAG TPA: hypothetical protein PLG90_05360 [Ignavibacteria bacterium]|nr:hypothetical protein [Ignavibacteria bacterium]
MKKIICLFFLILSYSDFIYSQFSQQYLSTDTSQIEITKNSKYYIFKEILNEKDSIIYKVYFIEDTTKIFQNGIWKKNGNYIGIWEEFNFDGILMYKIDYDKGIAEINKDFFPYHEILENMKLKVDSLFINTYSKEFFENHVFFDFDCSAYGIVQTVNNEGKSDLISKYVGSWKEPMIAKPNEFKFRYIVKLNKSDENGVDINILLDSTGNYLSTSDDKWRNYGFEEVKDDNKNFNININSALITAKNNGLSLTDTSIVSEFLFFENFKQGKFFNGKFRYYVTVLKNSSEYIKDNGRKGIIYRYDAYIFNPWTGEFIEKKKLKNFKEWEKNSGFNSGLIPDGD